MLATSVSPPAAYLGGGAGGLLTTHRADAYNKHDASIEVYVKKKKNPLVSSLETLQTLNRLYDLDKRSSGPPMNGWPGNGQGGDGTAHGLGGRVTQGRPGGPASRGASPPRPSAAEGA